MKTVTIQIGNSDDKLSQTDWHHFVSEMNDCVHACVTQVHFFGASGNWDRWQNAAWVVVGKDDQLADLRANVRLIRERFRQDSAAWTEGETLFV